MATVGQKKDASRALHPSPACRPAICPACQLAIAYPIPSAIASASARPRPACHAAAKAALSLAARARARQRAYSSWSAARDPNLHQRRSPRRRPIGAPRSAAARAPSRDTPARPGFRRCRAGCRVCGRRPGFRERAPPRVRADPGRARHRPGCATAAAYQSDCPCAGTGGGFRCSARQPARSCRHSARSHQGRSSA